MMSEEAKSMHEDGMMSLLPMMMMMISRGRDEDAMSWCLEG